MTTVADVDLSTWTRYATSPRLRGSDPFVTSGFPDATNTGVPLGTTLTSSGSVSSSSNGQVIEELDVTGTITITHDNVIVRKCFVTATAFYGINHNSGANLLVEDCEIINPTSSGLLAISGATGTYRRLNIHDSEGDNVKLGSNTNLHDSYLHSPNPTETSHNDGVQINSGSNILIDGNRIDGNFQGQTSAIIVQTSNSAIDNLTITNNRLSGGSYTLYLRDKGNGYGIPTNVTVTGNTWASNSWQFGSLSFTAPTTAWVWNTNVFSDATSYPKP